MTDPHKWRLSMFILQYVCNFQLSTYPSPLHLAIKKLDNVFTEFVEDQTDPESF